MSNTPGFAPLTPYVAPNQKMQTGANGTQGFFTPTDSTLVTADQRNAYLMPNGVNTTPEQVANRTVKLDGGLTREQVGNVGEALSGQIGTVNNNLTTGFTGLNTSLATQGTNLDKIGSNLTNYFTTLNAGQDAAKAQLGTLNTGFNSFVSDYDQDTTRADQSRTQIQNGMQGGFQQVGEQIGKASTATQQGLNNLSQPQRQGAQNLMGNVAGNGFASYTPPGSAPPQGQGGQTNPQMTQGINAIRTVLATQGGNLDPGMANSFNQIATSFDQNGQLIPESQGLGGVSISRQLDQNGNLVSAQKDANGQVLSQTMINMNASLMTANTLSQQQSPFRTA